MSPPLQELKESLFQALCTAAKIAPALAFTVSTHATHNTDITQDNNANGPLPHTIDQIIGPIENIDERDPTQPVYYPHTIPVSANICSQQGQMLKLKLSFTFHIMAAPNTNILDIIHGDGYKEYLDKSYEKISQLVGGSIINTPIITEQNTDSFFRAFNGSVTRLNSISPRLPHNVLKISMGAGPAILYYLSHDHDNEQGCGVAFFSFQLRPIIDHIIRAVAAL